MQKLRMLILAVLIGTCFAASACAADLWPAYDEKMELWGYIDATGAWTIEPQYISAYRFVGDYALATVDIDFQQDESFDGTGIIGRDGQWVLAPDYSFDVISGGCDLQMDECYWMYGNKSDGEGYFVISGCFDWRTGQNVWLEEEALEFDFQVPIDCDFVPVRQGAVLTYYDIVKQRLFPVRTDGYNEMNADSQWPPEMNGHCVYVFDSNWKLDHWCLFRADGTMSILPLKIEGQEVSWRVYSGDVMVCKIAEEGALSGFAIADEKGQLLTDWFAKINWAFVDGIGAAQDLNGVWQFIHADGIPVNQTKYQMIGEWIDGYVLVVTENGTAQILRKDRSVAYILPTCPSRDGADLGHDITWYDDFLFDRGTEQILTLTQTFSDIAPFGDDNIAVCQKYDRTVGFLHADGTCVMTPYRLRFDWRAFEDMDITHDLLHVTDGDLCGYINTQGEIAIPLQYRECSTFDGELALVYTTDNQAQYINAFGKVVKAWEDY